MASKELFTRTELEALVHYIHDSCACVGCDNCRLRGYLRGEQYCVVDVLMGLWRTLCRLEGRNEV